MNIYYDYFLNNERRIIKYEDPLLLWKLVAAICKLIVGYFHIIDILSEDSKCLRRVS